MGTLRGSTAEAVLNVLCENPAWRLNGFYDFTATETTGTDLNTLRLTVDQSSDWLEIRLKNPLGLVISVTDVIAGLAAFAAEITCTGHDTLLHLVESIENSKGQIYHRAIALDKQVCWLAGGHWGTAQKG